MGRGGGPSGGGRSGGFSRGGSRGFSSSRSPGSSSRSGAKSSVGSPSRGGAARPNGSARPSGPSRPRPNINRPFGFISSRPIIIFNKSLNKSYSGNSSGSNSGNSYSGKKKQTSKNGMPSWYNKLFIGMVTLTIVMVVCFVFTKIRSANENVRTKLPESACTLSSEWIDDRLGWISNESYVISSMEYFYDKTGVQPYLVITDNINGVGENITDSEAESYLLELYDSLYEDEGHMIFTFMEYDRSEYITFIYTGISADSVMDSEARGIFLDNADYYYADSSLSDDEYFAKIFEKSADEIMKAQSTFSSILGFLTAGCIIIVLVLGGGFIVFKIQEKKAEEAKVLKDIVDTPIGKSPEEKELEEKYLNKE